MFDLSKKERNTLLILIGVVIVELIFVVYAAI